MRGRRSTVPLYEFECATCSTVFEELLAVGARKPPCPSCKSRKVSKLMSAFAVASDGNTSARSGSACSTCSGGDCATCR